MIGDIYSTNNQREVITVLYAVRDTTSTFEVSFKTLQSIYATDIRYYFLIFIANCIFRLHL